MIESTDHDAPSLSIRRMALVTHSTLIRSADIPIVDKRKPYPIEEGPQIVVNHFVIRITTPENPFGPHHHRQPELWYILEGEAVVQLGEEEHLVSAGDLILIESGMHHGLRATSEVRWICLG
jgi:mannose-6-phosphate isomerase-like protein (cupin superfamily)